MPVPTASRSLYALVLVGLLGCTEPAGPPDASTDEWQAMVRAEELIHALTPRVARLAFAVQNLALPDGATRDLFAASGVAVRDLADPPFEPEPQRLTTIGATLRAARFAPRATATDRDVLRLWPDLLEEVSWFHHASLAVVRGSFREAGDGEVFETDLVFHGLAERSGGGRLAIDLDLTAGWRKVGTGPDDEAEWEIVSWEGTAGRRLDAAAPLFREVLDQALPGAADLERARDSIHERLVSDVLLEKRGRPHLYFSLPAQDRHPGLSVVDVDQDGFDDLYVMARWGPNQLLRNRGDGTYEEVAAELGLDVVDHSSSALFADFDNDGDPDLVLGRTLERSRYLENHGGRFVDRSEDIGASLPYLASSISAADYDRDGLLDVYIATYGSYTLATALRRHDRGTRRGDTGERYTEFLSNRHVERLLDLQTSSRSHPLIDAPGPPNVLLKNEGGGRFRRVMKEPIAAMRNTYQATWADMDGDGDQDVYLANDFAPDTLLRNDGGRFVDVTAEMVGADIGFGMGATWGDYDRDGRQDLYVTNMFSKAGTRITAALSDLDERYAQAAQGNYLFRNGADGLVRVSGDGPDELAVEHAGWGWGSLFADVDSDGFLDLLALSGYYTAPLSVRTAVDT